MADVINDYLDKCLTREYKDILATWCIVFGISGLISTTLWGYTPIVIVISSTVSLVIILFYTHTKRWKFNRIPIE
jgi:hypothetical protein